VRDPVIPVKLAAEAAFIELFGVVEEEGRVFEKFLEKEGADMQPNVRRSMNDYFKRVALRIAGQVRERRDAHAGGPADDEVDDEKEIWSVGSVEIGGGVFSQE
jgi:hypothetical protein